MEQNALTRDAPTLGFLLHEVARLMKRRFERHARGSGLTRSQWQVLAYLSLHEGIHQSGLAELLEISDHARPHRRQASDIRADRAASGSVRPAGLAPASHARRASETGVA